MTRTTILVSALLALAGCAPVPSPMANGPFSTYRYQGLAVYDQKPLAEIQAEFDQLGVSPSGKRVAFRGRESRDDYELFVGDVGGKVHVLAKTGLEPGSITWSADEKTLTFSCILVGTNPPGTPAEIPPPPRGRATYQLSLDGGEPRLVTGASAQGTVAPTADRTVVAQGGLTLIDLATGTSRDVEVTSGEVFSAWWAPDGKQLAYGTIKQAMTTIATVDTASAKSTPRLILEDNFVLKTLRWEPDGQALDAYVADPDDNLERFTLDLTTGTQASKTYKLDRLMPKDPAISYDQVFFPSPSQTSVLLRRYAGAATRGTSVGPDLLLLDLASGSTRAVAPYFEPVAWLNDHQVLGTMGLDQDKHILVQDL